MQVARSNLISLANRRRAVGPKGMVASNAQKHNQLRHRAEYRAAVARCGGEHRVRATGAQDPWKTPGLSPRTPLSRESRLFAGLAPHGPSVCHPQRSATLASSEAPKAGPKKINRSPVTRLLSGRRRRQGCGVQRWRPSALDGEPQHERYLPEEGGLSVGKHVALILRHE